MGGVELTKLRNLIIFLCGFLGIFFAASMNVSAATNVQRLGGSDRYDTAIQISKQGWQQSNYVVIVSGEDFPDALCAAPLAKKYNAPILLTPRTSMTDNTVNEIKRLGAQNAFIVGGAGVISTGIENQLKGLNVSFSRISGSDRYETSVKVAQIIGGSNGIVIAPGESFADALSIASISAAQQMPILLSETDSLPSNVRTFIISANPSKAYVVGGTGVVKDQAVAGINNLKRLGGTDRYDTNRLVIGEFVNSINFKNVYVATGIDFADALGGAAAAALTSSPIVLTDSSASVAGSVVQSNIASISSLVVLGGTGVVPDVTVQKIINGGHIKIALDAGHGGYDSGAVGPTGKYEKDATLAVVLKLGKILEQNGIEVIYTRTSDNVSWTTDINNDLQTRCDIANNAGVKYFISVHNNSAVASAHGTETYYMSGSTQGQILAQNIQNELIKATGLTDRGIKTANFYVIKNTDAPAVLTELAFISNPSEEALLFSDSFQNKCAQAIANGIFDTLN